MASYEGSYKFGPSSGAEMAPKTELTFSSSLGGKRPHKRGLKFGPIHRAKMAPQQGAISGSKIWPHFWGQNGPQKIYSVKYGEYSIQQIKSRIILSSTSYLNTLP